MKHCPPCHGNCREGRDCPARQAMAIDPFAWIDRVIDAARIPALAIALIFVLVLVASYLYTR